MHWQGEPMEDTTAWRIVRSLELGPVTIRLKQRDDTARSQEAGPAAHAHTGRLAPTFHRSGDRRHQRRLSARRADAGPVLAMAARFSRLLVLLLGGQSSRHRAWRGLSRRVRGSGGRRESAVCQHPDRLAARRSPGAQAAQALGDHRREPAAPDRSFPDQPHLAGSEHRSGRQGDRRPVRAADASTPPIPSARRQELADELRDKLAPLEIALTFEYLYARFSLLSEGEAKQAARRCCGAVAAGARAPAAGRGERNAASALGQSDAVGPAARRPEFRARLRAGAHSGDRDSNGRGSTFDATLDRVLCHRRAADR